VKNSQEYLAALPTSSKKPYPLFGPTDKERKKEYHIIPQRRKHPSWKKIRKSRDKKERFCFINLFWRKAKLAMYFKKRCKEFWRGESMALEEEERML